MDRLIPCFLLLCLSVVPAWARAAMFQDSGVLAAGLADGPVIALDADADGHTDLFYTMPGGRSGLLLQQPDGSWRAQALPGSGAAPLTAVAADLDRDGRTDLVLARAGGLDLLLNHGPSGFEQHRIPLAGAVVTSLAVADINADGWPDLLFVTRASPHTSPRVQVWLHDGELDADGLPQYRANPEAGIVACCTTTHLLLEDFDDDTALDVWVYGPGGRTALYRNNGYGYFEAVGQVPALADCDVASSGDIDGDGHVDLLLAGQADTCRPTLLGNLGKLKFHAVPASGFGLPALAGIRAAQWLDWNHDSHRDLLVQDAGGIRVFIQRPGGGFAPALVQPALQLADARGRLRLADLDADGRYEGLSQDRQGRLHLWRQTPVRLPWLGLRLRAYHAGAPAGAAAVIYRHDGSLVRGRLPAGSRQFMFDPRILIGIGPLVQIDLISVNWRSGMVSRLAPSGLRRYLLAEEPAYVPTARESRKVGVPQQFNVNAGQCR